MAWPSIFRDILGDPINPLPGRIPQGETEALKSLWAGYEGQHTHSAIWLQRFLQQPDVDDITGFFECVGYQEFLKRNPDIAYIDGAYKWVEIVSNKFVPDKEQYGSPGRIIDTVDLNPQRRGTCYTISGFKMQMKFLGYPKLQQLFWKNMNVLAANMREFWVLNLYETIIHYALLNYFSSLEIRDRTKALTHHRFQSFLSAWNNEVWLLNKSSNGLKKYETKAMSEIRNRKVGFFPDFALTSPECLKNQHLGSLATNVYAIGGADSKAEAKDLDPHNREFDGKMSRTPLRKMPIALSRMFTTAQGEKFDPVQNTSLIDPHFFYSGSEIQAVNLEDSRSSHRDLYVSQHDATLARIDLKTMYDHSGIPYITASSRTINAPGYAILTDVVNKGLKNHGHSFSLPSVQFNDPMDFGSPDNKLTLWTLYQSAGLETKIHSMFARILKLRPNYKSFMALPRVIAPPAVPRFGNALNGQMVYYVAARSPHAAYSRFRFGSVAAPYDKLSVDMNAILSSNNTYNVFYNPAEGWEVPVLPIALQSVVNLCFEFYKNGQTNLAELNQRIEELMRSSSRAVVTSAQISNLIAFGSSFVRGAVAAVAHFPDDLDEYFGAGRAPSFPQTGLSPIPTAAQETNIPFVQAILRSGRSDVRFWANKDIRILEALLATYRFHSAAIESYLTVDPRFAQKLVDLFALLVGSGDTSARLRLDRWYENLESDSLYYSDMDKLNEFVRDFVVQVIDNANTWLSQDTIDKMKMTIQHLPIMTGSSILPPTGDEVIVTAEWIEDELKKILLTDPTFLWLIQNDALLPLTMVLCRPYPRIQNSALIFGKKGNEVATVVTQDEAVLVTPMPKNMEVHFSSSYQVGTIVTQSGGLFGFPFAAAHKYSDGAGTKFFNYYEQELSNMIAQGDFRGAAIFCYADHWGWKPPGNYVDLTGILPETLCDPSEQPERHFSAFQHYNRLAGHMHIEGYDQFSYAFFLEQSPRAVTVCSPQSHMGWNPHVKNYVWRIGTDACGGQSEGNVYSSLAVGSNSYPGMSGAITNGSILSGL